jgi:hypothetical protein
MTENYTRVAFPISIYMHETALCRPRRMVGNEQPMSGPLLTTQKMFYMKIVHYAILSYDEQSQISANEATSFFG